MIPGYDHEMVSPDGAVPWISGPGVVYTVLARNSFRPAIGTVDGVYQDKFLAILLLFRIDVDDSRGHGENHLATNPPRSDPLAVGIGKCQQRVRDFHGHVAAVM